MKLCSTLILLILCAAQVRAATYGVTVPAQNTLTNQMLTYATSGRQLASTAIQQSGLTNLFVPGDISANTLNATNTITLGGTNIVTLISSVLQVFSGFYGGGLPTDTPTTASAMAFDLDLPGVLYFWDGSIWY